MENGEYGLRELQIGTILSKAKELRATYGDRLKVIVKENVPGKTVAEVVDLVQQELSLPEKSISSLKLAIHELIHELLTDEEIQERLQNSKVKNLSVAHERGLVDYVANGKVGGKARIEKLGTPGGEVMWTAEELQILASILEKPDSRYESGPYKGKRNVPKILEEFTALSPNTNRSLWALRFIINPNREKSQKTWQRLGIEMPQ